MIRSALSLAIALALSLPCNALAQDTGGDAEGSNKLHAIPLVFTGSNGQAGLAVDQDGRVQGEVLGVFGFDGRRAFLAEGWLGAGGAGGMKVGYHWLHGGADGRVLKLQLAADGNHDGDRKATLGFGFEAEGGEFGISWSRGITGDRLVDSDLERTTSTITGTQSGRPYRRHVTVDTLTQSFERAYEQGLGLRFGRFSDRNLLRLRGGVDLERGRKDVSAGERPQQHTASFGLDKYFAGTPYSVSVDLSRSYRSGALEEDRNDARATVRWRHSLGAAFAAAPSPTAAPAVPAPEQRVVRNEVEISGNARFGLDDALLDEAALRELEPLAGMLRTTLSGTVEIIGHTCDLGPDDYNQALSKARAEAVRDWLVAQGVPAGVLNVRGAGERAPAVPNDSEQGRTRNRRVELRFTTVEETRVEFQPAPAPEAVSLSFAPEVDAWVSRALRNLPAHKREVDSYRTERTTTTTTMGPVEFLNQAPVAVDDAATTIGDAAVTVAALVNDSDPDGDPIAIATLTQPGHGTTTLQGASIVYTATPGYAGADSFTYTITDGKGGTDTATVDVIISAPPPPPPTNRAPVAIDDSATTRMGENVLIEVLDNDSDPDGDALSIQHVGQPAHGTATLYYGAIVYLPQAGYQGSDTFSYTVEDGNGGIDTATVNVQIIDPNNAPVAVDDVATVYSSLNVDIDVLANDIDADNDPLFLVSWTSPAHGTVARVGSLLRYTPDADYEGPDAFTYIMTDGRVPDGAKVTINVIPMP